MFFFKGPNFLRNSKMTSRFLSSANALLIFMVVVMVTLSEAQSSITVTHWGSQTCKSNTYLPITTANDTCFGGQVGPAVVDCFGSAWVYTLYAGSNCPTKQGIVNVVRGSSPSDCIFVQSATSVTVNCGMNISSSSATFSSSSRSSSSSSSSGISSHSSSSSSTGTNNNNPISSSSSTGSNNNNAGNGSNSFSSTGPSSANDGNGGSSHLAVTGYLESPTCSGSAEVSFGCQANNDQCQQVVWSGFTVYVKCYCADGGSMVNDSLVLYGDSLCSASQAALPYGSGGSATAPNNQCTFPYKDGLGSVYFSCSYSNSAFSPFAQTPIVSRMTLLFVLMCLSLGTMLLAY
jgi:hypothetical protein